MAKFDPKEFNYELYGNTDGVLHYQKNIDTDKPSFIDVIELAYYSKVDSWAMIVKSENMRQFVPDIDFSDGDIFSLFIGKIKNDFDFRFIMNKIVKDPKAIVQMGC